MDQPRFERCVGTLRDLIAQGVLHDVTEAAADAGFPTPVLVTRNVWDHCIAWTAADNQGGLTETQTDRLEDVLYIAAFALMHSGGTRIDFPHVCAARDAGTALMVARLAVSLISPPPQAVMLITSGAEHVMPGPSLN